MDKMLFGLIGICCLSGFLIANPNELSLVREKEVMASCAIQFLREYPQSSLTIGNLTSDKPKLVRQISDMAINLMNLSLQRNETALVKILVDEYCPIPSPKKRHKKFLSASGSSSSASSSSAATPVQAYTHHDEQDEASATATTPSPSPVKTMRAMQQINTLHRQWTSKWSSDSDLQSLLRDSEGSSSYALRRKRTNSDSK